MARSTPFLSNLSQAISSPVKIQRFETSRLTLFDLFICYQLALEKKWRSINGRSELMEDLNLRTIHDSSPAKIQRSETSQLKTFVRTLNWYHTITKKTNNLLTCYQLALEKIQRSINGRYIPTNSQLSVFSSWSKEHNLHNEHILKSSYKYWGWGVVFRQIKKSSQYTKEMFYIKKFLLTWPFDPRINRLFSLDW